MNTSYFDHVKVFTLLILLIFLSSSCAQSPNSVDPPPTPTSSVPGYSLENPAPFGKILIQQLGGSSDLNIAPIDYLEVRPEAFISNADSFIDWTSSSSPGVGNKYVLVMISFYCIEGTGDEKDCTRLNLFEITDSNGNHYSQELNFFYEADGKEYEQELNLFYQGEQWQFINRSDGLNDNDKINEGDTITGAAIFEINKDAEGLVLTYCDGLPHPLYWELPEKDQ